MFSKIMKLSKLEKLFFLFFITMCFQNLIAMKVNSDFSLKLYHLVSLAFIPIIIKNKKITLPPKLLLWFIIYLFVISIIMFPKYGFDSIFLNYVFSLYVLVIICTIGKKVSEKNLIEIIKMSAWITLIATFIKCIIYRKIIISFFLSPYGHPIIPTFFGGGVNLEATWLGLMGILFYKDKKGYIYVFACAILSALYASRVGILATLITLLFLVFNQNKISLSKKVGKYATILIMGILGIIISNKIGLFDYVIKRFSIIGEDLGSLGRISMWQYVTEAIFKNPFGYGLGNSMKAIQYMAGKIYNEGNIHNLFFQILLDGGVIGEIWYIILIIYFCKKEFKNFFKDSIVAFIFGYIFLSLFQFRGGDAVFFFILGIYLNNKFYKKDENNHL